MKSNFLIIAVAFLFVGTSIKAQNVDSLSHYIVVAAENNPALKAEFLNYKASLEKVPQAGAFQDLQLEMGFFIPQMEVLDGKQIADFKLMQMFPWFGTRKAARNEATEMARMSYETFRSAKDNLVLEVKNSWFSMLTLQQKLTNIRENKELLAVLKELTLNRFSASGTAQAAGSAKSSSLNSQTTPPTTTSMGGMSMGGGAQQSAAPQSQSMGSMAQGGSMGSMGGSASSGMSSVLRVDIELNELSNEEQSVLSQLNSAKAKFNALLNREPNAEVVLPASIVKTPFSLDDTAIMDKIVQQNPMLLMTTAEDAAFKAKLEMDKKMGLPMFGVGLQYSVLGKRDGSMIPTTHMNGQNMVMPMVSLTIPIYRKKYKAQQNESRLRSEAAQQKYQSTLNNLSSEYSSLKEQLFDAERKVELYDNQQQLSLTTYQLALREFTTGSTTMTDVIDIERQLLDYKYRRAEAIATYNNVVAIIENLISETSETATE